MIFTDRTEAGRLLAEKLREYEERGDVVVLGVPRGGVPVAYEVAKALRLPLDIVVVKKMGYPGNPELALGAAGPDGYFLNEDLAATVPRSYIEEEAAKKQREAREKLRALRGSWQPLELKGKIVIVVDDGVATGASMIEAVRLVRSHGPASIVVAVPVAPPDSVRAIRAFADRVVAVDTPTDLYAIGQFYQDFTQVEDEEAKKLLEEARQPFPK